MRPERLANFYADSLMAGRLVSWDGIDIRTRCLGSRDGDDTRVERQAIWYVDDMKAGRLASWTGDEMRTGR